jgi:hypothetical protein
MEKFHQIKIVEYKHPNQILPSANAEDGTSGQSPDVLLRFVLMVQKNLVVVGGI